MLSQSEANYLIRLIKTLNVPGIQLPLPGNHIEIPAENVKENEKFVIDVNRRGTINIKKVTYQTRHNRTSILIRLDVEGRPHQNPDGEIIPCPHIHLYREGFHDKWAIPLPQHIITNTNDIARMLVDYLRYNNVVDIPPISQEFF